MHSVRAPLTPTLALMADGPSRDNVLPLDPGGALRVLPGYIAAALEVDLTAAEATAAIELHGVLRIQLPGNLLGFIEGPGSVCMGKASGQEAQQKQVAEHQHIPVTLQIIGWELPARKVGIYCT